MTTADDIETVSTGLKNLLLEKNRRYGDSALNPIHIFSKIESNEQLKCRLDDKISRIINSPTLRKNDIADVMGYLTLLCISEGWLTFDDLID